jgi:hypothetical protein
MEKNLKEELQRQFNVLINLEGKSFFEILANYIKFIIENPNLTPIINEILNEQRKDIKEFENFIKKCREKLDKIAKRLIKIVEKNKIKEPIIDECFKLYEKYKENPFTTLGCYHELIRIIGSLRGMEYKKPLFKKIKKRIERIEEDLLKSYDEYNKEINQRRNLENTKFWVSWKKLERIYKAIYKREELLKERDNEIKNKNFSEAEEIREIIDEIDWLRGIRIPPPGSRYQYLNKNDYIIHLSNIHEYLIEGGKIRKEKTPLKKEEIKKITLIKTNGKHKEYKLVINDNYDEAKKIRNSHWWEIFINQIENRNVPEDKRTNVKSVPERMKDFFNYNKKCAIYFGGKYRLTHIFIGRGEDIEINPEIETEIISEEEYQRRKKRKKKIKN